jgi:cell division protein FtsL
MMAPRRQATARATDPLQYAVWKQVRNNAVVREVDRGRQRELWRWCFVALVMVVLLLGYAYQHFELLRHGYLLEQLQQERAAEEQINRHLRLEIEMLRSLRRIESLATGQLQMVAPGAADAGVIEVVVAPEPPPRSVVASRIPAATESDLVAVR